VSAATASSRWLSGRGSDLALGCGGLYVVVFLLLSFAGPQMRATVPEGLLPLGALLLGAPHYGATLLRVYASREDLDKYRLFAVYSTIALFAAFVVGVYWLALGSLLVTLYLTWSPWHYTGQNYGIALLFLRRRSVPITPLAKRLLYASFLLSWILVVLAIHAERPSVSYAPVSLTSSAYTFLPVGIPIDVATPLLGVAALAYAFATAGAVFELLRSARWVDIAPALALMGLQALWFSLPVLARATFDVEGIDSLSMQTHVYAFFWIAFGHFAQYLWITTYYARSSRSESRAAPSLLKTLVAGSAIWGVPLLLFSPGLLGNAPFDAGLAVLVAAVVNIHHFILDGAIWKLRDGRIARVLLRSRENPADGTAPHAVGPARSPSGLRAAVAAAGVAYVVTTFVGTWETEFGFYRAAERGDVDRLRTASQRLRWVGRESPSLHAQIALFDARDGDLDAAVAEIERSLALHPTAEAWSILGDLRLRQGRREAAGAAYGQALRLAPDRQDIRRRLQRTRRSP
jgi:hypothetical protein